MFPNFTSLSQRERKRQNLLKQADRDLANDENKRQAYSQAMWSEDVIKNNINLTKSTTSTSVQTVATSPSPAPNGVFSSSSTIPPATSLVDATVNLTLLPRPRSETAADIGTAHDSLLDEFHDSNEDDPIAQGDARQRKAVDSIKGLLASNPDLLTWGIHPVKDDGTCTRHPTVVVGKNAELRNAVSGRKSSVDPDSIDWELTEEYIIDRMGLIKVQDSIRDKSRTRSVFEMLKAKVKDSKNERNESSIMASNDLDAPRDFGDTMDMEAQAKAMLLQCLKRRKH